MTSHLRTRFLYIFMHNKKNKEFLIYTIILNLSTFLYIFITETLLLEGDQDFILTIYGYQGTAG